MRKTYAALAPLLFMLTAAASPTEMARWRAEAGRVTITRDDWGIAHVHGKSDADAVFGMIYAQAEDDFPRIEANYLTSLGRTAEADGEKAIWEDLRARLYVSDSELKADYARSPAPMQRLMDAWADGLNYFLATHPKVKPRALTRFEPWMALSFTEGSIGGDIERIDLKGLAAFYSSNRHAELDSASILEAALPAKQWTLKQVQGDVQRDNEPRGSNGIAIAPALTRDGHALLLINPHTSFFFRSEQQVTSDEGLNAYGAATWGQFFIYQGFNPHAGWMHTSSGVDSVDEFTQKVARRGNGLCYRYGGTCRPMGVRPVTIRYRTANGRLATRNFTTYRTHQGPIVRSTNGRWVAFAMMNRPVEALQQSFLRTRASDLQSFMAVAQLKANSSNNTIFADDKGEIAYLHPQFVPRRDDRFDYTKPVDGSDPETDWGGLHSLTQLPNVIGPPNGWVDNNNNGPWSAAGAFSPNPAHFPKYMDMYGENYRGIHALHLLTGSRGWTLEGLNAAAFDTDQPAFTALLPDLIRAYDALPKADPMRDRLAAPVALLRGWNHRWSGEFGRPDRRQFLGGQNVAGDPAGRRQPRPHPLSRDRGNAGAAETGGARRDHRAAQARLRPLASAVGRGQPLPAHLTRDRPSVQRRRAEHPGAVRFCAVGQPRLVRCGAETGHQEMVRDQRQQLRGGGRVRQAHPRQGGDRGRRKRPSGFAALQR